MKPRPFKLEIGLVSFSCREGKVVTAINTPDAANGVIPAGDMLSSPVDWSSPARVMIGDDVVTSGQVVEAVPDDAGNVRWDVRSALMLSENRMPAMVLQNLSPSEVVYAAAREAGLDRDHMQIHGLDGLNAEAMWVLAPIHGLNVGDSTRVGIVEFIDGATGVEMLRRFDPALEPSLIKLCVRSRLRASPGGGIADLRCRMGRASPYRHSRRVADHPRSLLLVGVASGISAAIYAN
jgi:hypothetical protein